MKHTLLALAVAPGLIVLPLRAQATTWVVDDDSPADFTSLAEAIASPDVVDGDVLLVHSGGGEDFVLDKSLHIVAAAGTTFWSSSATIRDVETFTLSGLSGYELLVERVTGLGRIDSCRVGEFDEGEKGFVFRGSCRVLGCEQLLVTRSELEGSDGNYPEWGPEPGASVFRSSVAFVDCTLRGGFGDHYFGRSGLEALRGSDVSLTACSVSGNVGPDPFVFPAVWIDESTVRVRGSSIHEVMGGTYVFVGIQADPFDGTNDPTLIVSGVTLVPDVLPDWATVPEPAEPYLNLSGDDAPGSVQSVELYGPPGDIGFVGSSLAPHLLALTDPPGELLWLNPSRLLSVVPLTTAGQDTAQSYTVTLPTDPAFAGTSVLLQAWFPPFSTQSSALTNPTDVVLKW